MEIFDPAKFDFFIEKEDFKMFKRAFDLLDDDKSGKLTMTEIEHLIKNMSEGSMKKPSQTEINQILSSFDQSGDGEVEFNEFLKVMAGRAELEKIKQKTIEFQEAFAIFDSDGSGQVSSKELKTVLMSCGSDKMTDAEFDEMVEHVDENKNGMIDFNELIKLFTGAASVQEAVTGKKGADENKKEEKI